MKQIFYLCIICSILMVVVTACQKKDICETESMHQELFELSKQTVNVVTSYNEYTDIRNKTFDFEECKKYYIAHGKSYQKGYSSLFDIEEHRIACIEYLMSQRDFLLRLSSNQRKELLCLSLEKQKQKFDEKDCTPFVARQTGLFLVIQLLLTEKDEEALRSISDYCDKHQFLYGIYNDEEFNDFLLQVNSNYCNK